MWPFFRKICEECDYKTSKIYHLEQVIQSRDAEISRGWKSELDIKIEFGTQHAYELKMVRLQMLETVKMYEELISKLKGSAIWKR